MTINMQPFLDAANNDMLYNRWTHDPNAQRLFWLNQLTKEGLPGDTTVFAMRWPFVDTDEPALASPATDPADPINPAHYRRSIEVADFIEVYDLDFFLGNVVKYVARHADKGKPLEDLKKAQWYLDRAVANMTTEQF